MHLVVSVHIDKGREEVRIEPVTGNRVSTLY